MQVQSLTESSRRRRFWGRHASPAPAAPAAPLGYDVELAMLDELYRTGRISRSGYEVARRQLQKNYGMCILPESSVREP